MAISFDRASSLATQFSALSLVQAAASPSDSPMAVEDQPAFKRELLDEANAFLPGMLKLDQETNTIHLHIYTSFTLSQEFVAFLRKFKSSCSLPVRITLSIDAVVEQAEKASAYRLIPLLETNVKELLVDVTLTSSTKRPSEDVIASLAALLASAKKLRHLRCEEIHAPTQKQMLSLIQAAGEKLHSLTFLKCSSLADIDIRKMSITLGPLTSFTLIDCTKCTEKGIKLFLTKAGSCLQELDLSGCALSDAFLTELCELGLKSLAALRLARCIRLSAAGIKQLLEKYAKTLSAIDLSECAIDAEELVKQLSGTNLTKLFIRDCKNFTNRHSEKLALALPEISHLDIRGTFVTYAGITTLLSSCTKMQKLQYDTPFKIEPLDRTSPELLAHYLNDRHEGMSAEHAQILADAYLRKTTLDVANVDKLIKWAEKHALQSLLERCQIWLKRQEEVKPPTHPQLTVRAVTPPPVLTTPTADETPPALVTEPTTIVNAPATEETPPPPIVNEPVVHTDSCDVEVPLQEEAIDEEPPTLCVASDIVQASAILCRLNEKQLWLKCRDILNSTFSRWLKVDFDADRIDITIDSASFVTWQKDSLVALQCITLLVSGRGLKVAITLSMLSEAQCRQLFSDINAVIKAEIFALSLDFVPAISLIQELESLRQLSFSGCTSLTDDALQNICYEAAKLERVHICKCPKVTYLGWFRAIFSTSSPIPISYDSLTALGDLAEISDFQQLTTLLKALIQDRKPHILDYVIQSVPLTAERVSCLLEFAYRKNLPELGKRCLSWINGYFSSRVKIEQQEGMSQSLTLFPLSASTSQEVTEASLQGLYACLKVLTRFIGSFELIFDPYAFSLSSQQCIVEILRIVGPKTDTMTIRCPESIKDPRRLVEWMQCCPMILHLYLDNVQLHESDLESILEQSPGIASLSLRNCNQVSHKALAHILKLQYTQNLTSLSLWGNDQLTDIDIAHIAKQCPALQHLDLTGCTHLTDDTLKSLDKFAPQLVTLSLCATLLSLTTRFELKNLQKLDLSLCQNVTDSTLDAMKYRNASRLRVLCLAHNQKITGRGLKTVAREVPLLEHLDLCQCEKVTDEDITLLAHNLQYLQSIDVRGCYQLCQNAVKALVENCPALVRIQCDIRGQASYLSYYLSEHKPELKIGGESTINNEVLRLISLHSQKLQHEPFQSVHLYDCPFITCEGLAQLSQCAQEIRKLTLVRTGCTDDRTIQVIVEQFRNLRVLRIEADELRITDEGLCSLTSYGKNLQAVSIKNGHKLTDEGVKNFVASCSNLSYLSLKKCSGITISGLIYVVTHSPNLKVLEVDNPQQLFETLKELGIETHVLANLEQQCSIKSLRVGTDDADFESHIRDVASNPLL